MADCYAFLDTDGQFLFVRQRNGAWEAVDRPFEVGPKGRKLTVFVDGLDVLNLEVTIPSKSESEVRKAAPFAVEDELAVSVEDAHIALSAAGEGSEGSRRVSVVSPERMTEWIAHLDKAGLSDADIVAAHAVLPLGDRMIDAGDVVLGRSAGRTYAYDRSAGRDVFAGLAGRGAITIEGDAFAEQLGRPSAGAGYTTKQALLAQLAEWANAGPATWPTLRQGQFGVRQSVDMSGIGKWRLVGSLAAALGIGWFAAIWFEINGLAARDAMLTKRTAEFVEAGWPAANGDPNAVLRTDVSGAIKPISANSVSPLTLLASLYEAMETEGDSELKSVRYSRERQEMTVRIGFADFVSVDRLSSALEELGVSVETGDARQSGRQVIGELTLRGANA